MKYFSDLRFKYPSKINKIPCKVNAITFQSRSELSDNELITRTIATINNMQPKTVKKSLDLFLL